MRHRRRLTTQTIQRKNSTGTFQAIQTPKKSKAGKYFLTLLIIASLVSAGIIYKDKIVSLFPFESINFSFDSDNTVDTDTQTQLPPKEDEVKQEQIPFTPIQKRIQIEVLNGCGIPGIAKKIESYLKKHNYDVVNRGNYIEKGKNNFNVPKSKIIDQLKSSENIARANELADLLGIDQNLIESFENPSPIADLTLIVGRDQNQLTLTEE